jgi:hypothetical protein
MDTDRLDNVDPFQADYRIPEMSTSGDSDSFSFDFGADPVADFDVLTAKPSSRLPWKVVAGVVIGVVALVAIILLATILLPAITNPPDLVVR